MKRTKILIIACLLLSLVIASGCTHSAPSEKQILADIPDGFLTVSVDGIVQNMSINGIEIEKRQTDKKSDIVYFTLNMSNEDYKLSAYCCFQYGYYNQGGWIVDSCEIVNEQYELIPLKGISQKYANETISGYFENYSLDGDGFDGSNAWFTYSISESHKYCSYNGLVDVNYSFYTRINCSDDPYTFENNVYANWEENVSDLYRMTYDWNIEGDWYGIPKNNYELYLNVSSYNQNTAYVEAVSPHEGNEYSLFGDRMEYNGDVAIDYDYSNLGSPVLKFNFVIRKDGSAYYQIWIYPDYAEMQRDGYDIESINLTY